MKKIYTGFRTLMWLMILLSVGANVTAQNVNVTIRSWDSSGRMIHQCVSSNLRNSFSAGVTKGLILVGINSSEGTFTKKILVP